MDLKSLLDVFVGHQVSGKSRFVSADILLSFWRVSVARCAIQILWSGYAHNHYRNCQTRRQSPRAGTLLSCRPVRSRSRRFLITIASLHHLFFQHLSDEAIRACLLPKEAPNDQSHEGQAEGQHLPPGPLLLPSQRMLHRPAGRVGFAGGKQNGAVSVFFFALGRRLGPRPATGRRMQASGRPVQEPQRPDGPGRRHTQDAAQHDPGTALGAAARHAPITSVAQNRKPDAVPGLRSRLQNVGPLAQRK